MKPRLESKVALITGGSSGIGRVTAKRFVEEGAWVAISGRTPATLDETVAEFGPSRAMAFKADAASPAEMRRVIEAVKAQHGRLDVLSPEQLQHMAAGIAKMTPAGRFGEAIEVAECVVFLASDESRYVIGADLAVDGGFAQL